MGLPHSWLVFLKKEEKKENNTNTTQKYRYHSDTLPAKDQTGGVDCAIVAFANSSLFASDPPGDFKPFMSAEDVKAKVNPDAKVLFAIGGWGDTAGFSAGAKDDGTRELYAKNIAAAVDKHKFDGVGKKSPSKIRNSQQERDRGLTLNPFDRH